MHRVLRSALVSIITLAMLASAVAQQQAQSVKAPGWVKAGVIYEIYPRQYSATGDFAGIERDLDRLKDLGVNILWLMPIHPIGQEKKKGTIGSPYAVRDYMGINPAYGTAADLKRLVKAAHARGLKVIIDQVLNHTAWDNVLIKKHPEWYKRDAKGNITYPFDWFDIAALDYSQPELRRYQIDQLKYWIREFDLDGFRCDVAGEVPTDFWEAAVKELEQVKPDIFMLAEANKPELLNRAFHADYAWPMYHALAKVLQEGAPASLLQDIWKTERAKFPQGAMEVHFYDNHDEKRGVSRFGEKGVLAGAAYVLTLDGIPLVYNGNEAGDSTESGAPALFEKMPIFWKFAERRPEFPKFYKGMINLRRTNPALQQGALAWISNSDAKRVVSYTRTAADEQFLVVINFSNQPFSGTVDAQGSGYEDVTPVLDEKAPQSTTHLPQIELPAWGFRVLRKLQ